MTFNNKTYDVLKFIALIALPALAVLYSGVGSLWEVPATERVVSTIVLLDTFLGALLQISSSQYKNSDRSVVGYLNSNGVDPDTGHANLQLTLTKLPNEILEDNTARFKIGPPPAKLG